MRERLLSLHGVQILLQTDDDAIVAAWKRWLSGWPEAGESNTSDQAAEISLKLSISERLPALPDTRPSFSDGQTGLSVYRDRRDSGLLHFHNEAVVKLPIPEALPHTTCSIVGWLVPSAVARNSLEDIIYTSLAPLLRRKGYYLVHAFAASKAGKAVLLVGPTGSGKTTTGLSLILDGWAFLANDVLILQERPEGIYALATPGEIGIRQGTYELLPHLGSYVDQEGAGVSATTIATERLTGGHWSAPCRIDRIYFPSILCGEEIITRPLSSAICMASLTQESIDRWDPIMLSAHLDILEKLSQQAASFELKLGRDISLFPQMLAS